MTPVGSQLKERLEDRRMWFANEWFHKWHYIGGRSTVEIDTFDGRKARYAGLRFDGSPLEVYWYAIARGARKEIIDQLEWVESRAVRYERSVAETAIDECADLLVAFVASLRHAAVEKDRILRGNGIEFPPRREAGIWTGTSELEIRQLAAELKKALFPTSVDPRPTVDPASGPERRLAVVFVADVVGYSKLANRDEWQVISQLKTFQSKALDPALTKYRGRIFNTGGDSFHLEFSSVIAAIECWLETLCLLKDLQKNTPTEQLLRFRTGMHLGEVLVEGTNLLGDTVNIASRLQRLAHPDCLCTSSLVVDQVAKRTKLLTFSDIGYQPLKNMPPVHAYVAHFSQQRTGNPPTEDEHTSGMTTTIREAAPQQFTPPLDASSDRMATLIDVLARHCPDGLGRTRYSPADIQKLLPGVPSTEIEDLVHELEVEGLVTLTKFIGGSWHLSLTSRFYEVSDGSLMGWSTVDDARRLAEQMLSSNSGRALTLHAASGWDRRRFNPAFRYVLDQLPSNFVSKERSADYPASIVLMEPKVRAALRKMTAG